MTTEHKLLIEEYTKKANESSNSYEKQIYFKKIEELEKGICPMCHQSFNENKTYTIMDSRSTNYNTDDINRMVT